MKKLARVAGAGVAALALTTVTVASGPAATANRAQADAGAAWLVTQLDDDDLIPSTSPGYADYGLSIDAALALDEVGGQDQAVTDIRDAVASGIENYATPYEYPDDQGNTYGGTPSNATGKTAVLATETGGDPADFGGIDLIAQLEGVINNKGVLKGRLSDDPTKNGKPDPTAPNYANTFGQAFAVHALSAARSPEAVAARDFLLDQQCRAGFFRLSFSGPSKADQSCDGAKNAKYHVDATALAVIELESVRGGQATQARARAIAWLRKIQRTDGSFVDTTQSSGPNANSTGLAAWALDQEGARNPALKAGRWLRQHQLTEESGCGFAEADLGAIAFNNAGYRAVQEETIDDSGLADQFRRVAGQALPGLLASGAAATGTPCD